MNKLLKLTLKKIELEIVECWSQAMENDNIPYGDTIMQAGMFAERICKAQFIRTYQRRTRMTFANIIKHFKEGGVFDNQLASYAHHFRKDSNDRRHSSTTYQKSYIDITRLKMVDMMKWYLQHNNIRLKHLNLERHIKRLNKSAAASFLDLQKRGVVSETFGLDKHATNEFVNGYEVSNKDHIVSAPVYAGLLIDESGSLRFERSKVIQGQNEALAAIRGSKICKHQTLHLIQQTFNDETSLLNPLTIVDHYGDDNVVELSQANYNPTNRLTRLYDAIYQLIMLLIREKDSLELEKGRKPEISIGVITDGKDYTSVDYTPEDIKALIYDLRRSGILKSAVLIGWQSDNFTENDLNQLKIDLGFDEYIGFDISEPKAIRHAFKFFSEMFENYEQ